MTEWIKNKFKHLLGRFSYRQRFIFWVVIVFLVVPVPAYWILRTQNHFRSRANLQLLGSEEAKIWFKAFDAFLDNYIAWTCRMASGDEGYNELVSLKRKIREVLESLHRRNAISAREVIFKRGIFLEGAIVKNHKEDLEFLKRIWEQVSQQRDIKDIKNYQALYHQGIRELAKKIQTIAFDYHLILHTDRPAQGLSQAIYFSLVTDALFLADLNQAIANLRTDGENFQDNVDRVKVTLRVLKEHFTETKASLEFAYREAQTRAIWKNFSYYEVQERLMNCIQLHSRAIDRVQANLSALEQTKEFWQSSHSLFIKNAACLQNIRKLANDIFDEMLVSERNFYFWQQAIVISALAFFVFILFIFVVFRFLTGHFRQMHSYIQGLSQGCFTHSMNANPHEEMGQIAIALERMGRSIEKVSDQLKVLGFGLAESIEKIEATAREQLNVMEVQKKCLKNLDYTINQIAVNSRELADTMDAFTQISKERIEQDESNKGLQHLQDKMSILKNGSIHILEVLSIVHEKGLSTRKLTTYITKISDHASLLALNAAIESLNVGELQAFGDITGKIQHFAQSTSVSTLAIQKIVSEMSESVVLGKVTTESCVNEITLGANRLIEVSNQLKTISNQDALQNDKFHTVNLMMQQQAQRSEGVIQSVSGLSVISEQNKKSVDNLYQTISELGIFSQELRSIVRTLFRDSEIITSTIGQCESSRD